MREELSDFHLQYACCLSAIFHNAALLMRGPRKEFDYGCSSVVVVLVESLLL